MTNHFYPKNCSKEKLPTLNINNTFASDIKLYNKYFNGRMHSVVGNYNPTKLNYISSNNDSLSFSPTSDTIREAIRIGDLHDFDFKEDESFSFYVDTKIIDNEYSAQWISIAGSQGADNGDEGFLLGYYGGNLFCQIWGLNTVLGTEPWIITPNAYNFGDRTKILMVVNRSTETMYLYLDGKYNTNDHTDTTGTGDLIATNDAYLNLGCSGTNGTSTNTKIYEAAIFNKALTEEEAILLTSPEFSLSAIKRSYSYELAISTLKKSKSKTLPKLNINNTFAADIIMYLKYFNGEMYSVVGNYGIYETKDILRKEGITLTSTIGFYAIDGNNEALIRKLNKDYSIYLDITMPDTFPAGTSIIVGYGGTTITDLGYFIYMQDSSYLAINHYGTDSNGASYFHSSPLVAGARYKIVATGNPSAGYPYTLACYTNGVFDTEDTDSTYKGDMTPNSWARFRIGAYSGYPSSKCITHEIIHFDKALTKEEAELLTSPDHSLTITKQKPYFYVFKSYESEQPSCPLVTLTENTIKGTLNLSTSGYFTYDYTGSGPYPDTDTFKYTFNDNNGTSNEATVTLTIDSSGFQVSWTQSINKLIGGGL